MSESLSLKDPGQTAFEAYWETPNACWSDMSDLGKAKWAQAERKIVASAEAAAHAKGRAEGIGEALLKGEPYPKLTEAPEHCGGSILTMVAELYEARNEIARLRKEGASHE